MTRYSERRAAGGCASCPGPARWSRCDPCAAREARARASERVARAASGRCARCGHGAPIAGQRECARCKAREAAR